MVILRIRDPEIIDDGNVVLDNKGQPIMGPDGQPLRTVEHIGTDWQISKTMAFNDIIASVENDTENKVVKIFSDADLKEPLDPNYKYYARARALLSTGYTVWGNLDIFQPSTMNDSELSADLPSRVAIPKISTTAKNPNAHDASMFRIHATGFSTVGSATHTSTSWIIEKADGNVIWSSLENTAHKDYIDVNDILLEDNEIYRIRAMFHSSSGDASQMGTYTIFTDYDKNIDLATYVDAVDVKQDLRVELNDIPENPDIKVELLKYNHTLYSNVHSETLSLNEGSFLIPKQKLELDRLYLLRIQTVLENSVPRYIPFRTIQDTTTTGAGELEGE